MLGFIIGTACLVGLVATLRRGRRFGRGCGHGWGRGRRAVFWLFERLETSPGQEKVIRTALDDVRRATEGARDEAARARADVARAVRSEVLDEDALRAATERFDAAVNATRSAATDALRRVHETLDERQRRTLAGVLEGERVLRRDGGGPYRAA